MPEHKLIDGKNEKKRFSKHGKIAMGFFLGTILFIVLGIYLFGQNPAQSDTEGSKGAPENSVSGVATQ